MLKFPKPEKKAKKKASKKRNPKKTLDNKILALWSKIVRSIGYCECCGKSDCALDAHHIFSRRWILLRYHLPNGICLCKSCHTFNKELSAHQAPMEFYDFLDNYLEDGHLDKLRELKKPYKFALEELQEIYNDLERIAAEKGIL